MNPPLKLPKEERNLSFEWLVDVVALNLLEEQAREDALPTGGLFQ